MPLLDTGERREERVEENIPHTLTETTVITWAVCKVKECSSRYAWMMPHIYIHAYDPSLIVSEVVQGETVGIRLLVTDEKALLI